MDPNAWLIYKLIANIHDMALGFENQLQGGVTITPNPTTNGWQVTNVSANSDLTLTDMTGRVLWKQSIGNAQNISIPAGDLSPGMYVLSIAVPGTDRAVYKLVKN